jgi:hypothetical protein
MMEGDEITRTATQDPPPLFGLVANVKSDHALRTGAKVWIHYCHGDAAHPFVSGISKSGRPIQKYTRYKRLTNFRAAWIPPPLRDRITWTWPDKEAAAQVAAKLEARWSDVRYFNPTGTELKQDGISEGESFRRAQSAIIGYDTGSDDGSYYVEGEHDPDTGTFTITSMGNLIEGEP